MRTRRMNVMGAVAVGLLLGSLAAFAEEANVTAATNEEVAIAGEAQTTCPVMGEPIDKRFHTDYKGKRVYFCCNMCPKTFAKDPDKYMKKLQDAGIALEDAPGTPAQVPSAGTPAGTENEEHAGHHHE